MNDRPSQLEGKIDSQKTLSWAHKTDSFNHWKSRLTEDIKLKHFTNVTYIVSHQKRQFKLFFELQNCSIE
jgi:hypothetical protein